MDLLNEDCLHQIFQYLPLRDQVALLNASNSFVEVLSNIWRAKYKKLFLQLNSNVPLELKEKKFFLDNVHQYVEQLRIESNSKNILEALHGIRFIRTHKLYVSIESSEMLGCEFVAKLHDIFPNIKDLQPVGKFSGAGFNLWNQLEQLTLCSCYSFRFEYLEQILRELPLHTLVLKSFQIHLPFSEESIPLNCMLRVLVLNSYELCYFTPRLENLRHLKELHISDLYSTSNLNALHIKLVELHNTHQIEAISTRDITAILPKVIDLGLHMHLKRLKLAFDPQAFSDMLLHISLLTNLRVLHFHACYVRSEQEFQKLFLVSAHLDEISLEDCFISFGSNPCLDVKEVIQNRTKPITFNFYENKLGFSDAMAKVIIKGCSNLLKLECEQKTINRCRYLVYEFS
uniref:F-box domain-containing protein n=1 Tax=Ceratitis capitata TaxID=7213 RepID=W8BDH7_CERCA